MDRRLEDAKRDFERNTTDTEAAQRYEAELERAGRHEDIVKLYRLAKECTKTWATLTPISDYGNFKARHCDTCNETVIKANSIVDFMYAIKTGKCVSIQARTFDQATDKLREHGLLSFARGKGKQLPCVVPEMWYGSAFPATLGRPARYDPDAVAGPGPAT